MKNNSILSLSAMDVEARFAEINALQPEFLTNNDLEAIAKANAENPDDTISLDDYKLQREQKGTS